MRRFKTLAVLIFISSTILHAQDATPLYAGYRNGDVIDEIDTTGGVFTVVGSTTTTSDFGPVNGIFGLAMDPTDEQMYCLYETSGGENNRRLGALDTETGSITDIGNSGNMTDIDFDGDGGLYATGGWSGSTEMDLWEVDKVTGTSSFLFVSVNNNWGSSVAYNPFADELLILQASDGYSSVDPLTLVETDLAASTPGDMSALVVINETTAWTFSDDDLYELDLSSGNTSFVGTFSQYHALGFGPLPCTPITAEFTSFEVCEGSEVTLVADSPGGGTITWDMGVEDGVPFDPGAPGVYNYTATSDIPGECELHITVEVFPIPTVIAGSGDENYCEGETVVLSAGGDAEDYEWDPLDFDPGIGTHTYFLTGSSDNGCINYDTLEITVHPLPTVTANTDDDLLCTGDTIVLTGGGAETYVWDFGIIDGAPHVPGLIGENTFTVTGTDENGCDNEASVTVDVVDHITITGVTTDEIAGADGTIDISILGGAPVYTVDWDDDEIGEFDDPADRTGLTAGTYDVVVRGSEGCEGAASFVINSQLKITNTAIEGLEIYPNPTQDHLIITLNSPFNYTLQDLSGKTILQGAENGTAQIALDQIAVGAYILTVQWEGQKVIEQIIKQ